MEAVSSLHVSAPALIGAANIRERKYAPDELAGDFYDSALDIPAFELLEFAPDFLDTLKAHFAKDLPGLRQLEADLQELEALAELLDFRLLRIKNNAERIADLFHASKTLFEVFLARVNQIAIVHISGVAFNAELLFDEVVELVRQHKGGSLRDLTSEPVTDGTEVIETLIRKSPDSHVMHALCQLAADRPMLSVGEVVGKVKEKNIALTPVFPVVSLQVAGEAVKSEVDSLVLSTCAVVIDECRLERRVDDLIAKRSLNDSLADMNTPDVPHFPSVVEVELDKASALIRPIKKRAARCRRIRYKVEAVHLRRAFPANAATADMPGLI